MNHPLRTRAARRRVALTLAATLALPAALPVGTAGATHYSNTEELTAEDNVGAAIAYSTSTFAEPVEEVALGRDDTFPDSLASGMLQGTRPLLLTAPDALSEPTKEELARLQPTTVHVLGGEQAIQPAVVEALETEGYTVVRHAGPTRIDTAVEVARNLGAAATQAIIARAFGSAEDESRAFADSLAAGGWAAGAAIPVLLTETEQLSEATGAYLGDSSITEVFVVGGEAAVSPQVVTQLEAQGLTVKRVSGPTRFHTALAIAVERGFATAADAEKVILTEGQAEDAWAAGFAAAARSAADNAPIVLAVGTEVPEPTRQFLNGGEEPSEDPEAQDPIAALLCGPKLAIEACDAAAIALGQLEGAGGELLEIPNTAVGRFDHVTGTLAEPKAVNGFHVTGCGYTNEPIFFEPSNGVFYLMLAGDPGVCSAEFSLTLSAGVIKQTVEFTVGEDVAARSSMVIPELVEVRPVKQDEEGVHLRYVFDEPIAPSPAIDASRFHLFTYEGKPSAGDDLPSFVGQDPRNPSAVIAIFPATLYEDSTVAAVRGGYVCPSSGNTQQQAPCNDDEFDPDHADFDPETARAAFLLPNGDRAVPGAVRDIDRFPNPTGHFPLRTIDRTGTASDAPDLLSVGDYQPADNSLLFTFSEEVALPTTAKAGAGAATVLLQDGTIKASDANGWRAGPTPDSLRVTFTAAQLSPADMEQIRRGFVEHGTVLGTDTDLLKDNTPVTAIIAGGGISVRPDFVNIENEQYTTTPQVTFVFEEDLDEVNATVEEGARFVAIKADGEVVYSKQSSTDLTKPRFKDNDKRKVVVPFDDLDLKEAPRYFAVLTDAVKSFASQQWNFADSIRLTTPVIYGPGRTDGPDLTGVELRDTDGTCENGLETDQARFQLKYMFDQDVDFVNEEAFTGFEIWHVASDETTKPRVLVVGDDPDQDTADLDDVGRNVEHTSESENETGGVCVGTGPEDPGAPSGWQDAKYLAVDIRAVKDEDDHTLTNYPAGMAIPN